jgi:hypothetical protein
MVRTQARKCADSIGPIVSSNWRISKMDVFDGKIDVNTKKLKDCSA